MLLTALAACGPAAIIGSPASDFEYTANEGTVTVPFLEKWRENRHKFVGKMR